MRKIYKYTLHPGDQEILIPADRRPLCAAMQGRNLCMWVDVDINSPMLPMPIFVRGTGEPLCGASEAQYLGTAHDNGGLMPLVWHVFYL